MGPPALPLPKYYLIAPQWFQCAAKAENHCFKTRAPFKDSLTEGQSQKWN